MARFKVVDILSAWFMSLEKPNLQQRQVFTDHIQPLHDQLMVIHSDHMTLLSQLRKLVDNTPAFYQLIRDRRTDRMALRHDTRGLCQTFRMCLEDPAYFKFLGQRQCMIDFIWACNEYFDVYGMGRDPGDASMFVSLLDCSDGYGRNYERVKSMLQMESESKFLQLVVESNEKSAIQLWKKINLCFGKCRIEMLK